MNVCGTYTAAKKETHKKMYKPLDGEIAVGKVLYTKAR
jgi:hypothetical protein